MVVVEMQSFNIQTTAKFLHQISNSLCDKEKLYQGCWGAQNWYSEPTHLFSSLSTWKYKWTWTYI